MKIKANLLLELIEKATMDYYIPEGFLLFTDKGIAINCIDPAKVVFSMSILDKENVEEYQELPAIPIKDFVEFCKFLKRFGKELMTFSVKDNKILLKAKSRQAKYIISDPEFIAKEYLPPNFDYNKIDSKMPSETLSMEYENELVITQSMLTEITKNLTTTIKKTDKYVVNYILNGKYFDKGENSYFLFSVTSGAMTGNQMKEVCRLKGKKHPNFRVMMGSSLTNILSSITSGNAVIRAKTDTPMTIATETAAIKSEWVIADCKEDKEGAE